MATPFQWLYQFCITTTLWFMGHSCQPTGLLLGWGPEGQPERLIVFGQLRLSCRWRDGPEYSCRRWSASGIKLQIQAPSVTDALKLAVRKSTARVRTARCRRCVEHRHAVGTTRGALALRGKSRRLSLVHERFRYRCPVPLLAEPRCWAGLLELIV